ncbi:hypothetical protein Mal15_04410 [Stieleria maiorica]|uniref:LamG-like jellyroll fold domain-containing protein n=1 Tax=Stieleria maiorica TaxID=2795974 RepID=A0A5B9M6X2_9BACT|nr:DUF2341 domain-containing protein [Stieleria maiorica]QEF96413.1 hypothetical protein Mal15_04410 [Stieleria maiorica]
MPVKPPIRVFDFYPLEDRILLSADAPDTIDAGANADAAYLDALIELIATEGQPQGDGHAFEGLPTAAPENGYSDSSVQDELASDAASPSPLDPARPIEVVFVDAGVEDAETLIDGLRADADDATQWLVIELAGDEDGIDQISRSLAGLSGVDAVHLVSHGDGQGLRLGNARLDLDTATGYAQKIASWAGVLDADADLLIYGCDLASTDDGRELIDTLAALCDCDVAASEDATGHQTLGGDWDFEYQVGTIQTEVAFSLAARSAWEGTLATYTVTNTNDSGAGSLRQAILDANANAGLDTIDFNITGTGVHVISLNSGLSITDAVTLDGLSEPDYAGTPVVRIDGNASGFSGISVAAGGAGSTIQGLMITGFTLDGIHIASGANNVTIADNWIGTSGTGSTGIGNGDDGIDIAGSNAQILRNVITNNGDEGITIVGTGVTGHVIQGNYVGLDPDGATGGGNTDVGIAIISGTGNTIGGTTSAQRNVISMNWEGIEINTSDNIVQGNFIGTDESGALDRGNRIGDGIEINSGTNNLVGGSVSGAGNVISANADSGVVIKSGASNTTITGNFIGTDAYGLNDLGNTNDGIVIIDSANNTIGGVSPFQRNVISGNGLGIRIGGAASTGNVILNNYIGTDVDGNATLGNDFDGIFISRFAGAATGNPTNNVIWGSSAGDGNLIAGNLRDGIRLYADAGIIGNSILSNVIHSNAGLGIDLGGDGVTANDSGDSDAGANNLQNYPILTSAQMVSATDVNIIGTLNGIANSYYRIEFFADATGNGSGYGEGQRFLGYVNVTTDGSGNAAINATFSAPVVEGEFISATATKSNISFDSFSDTSEFAQNVTVTNTAPVATDDAYSTTVNTTLDVGPTTTNLANWWQFDEGSGQNTVDSGSMGNDATLGATAAVDSDDPTWSTGYVGSGALTFDGSTDYVATTSTVAQSASSFTLSAWFQTTTTTGQQHILWQGYSSGNGYGSGPGTPAEAEMGLTIGTYNQSSKIVFFLGYDVPANGADPIYIVSNSDFTDTTNFHHAAVTVTDLGGGVFSASLYVDGVLEGTDTGVQNDRSAWGNLQIGKPGAATRYFSGQIDDVRVYDTALSAGQVQAIAQSGVLQNDSDPDSRPIKVNTAVVAGPSNGTLSINADGSFSYTPNLNFNGVDSFTYQTNDGSLDSNVATVTITVNDDPVIATSGGATAFTENTTPTLIDTGFTATDPYSTDFDTGTLTVSFSAGSTANDQLTVVDGGSVTVVGNTVRHGGVDVGTWSGGSAGSDLVITFNANSTPAIVQAIGRQIAYFNASDNPSTASRTVDFVLTDGDSGTSNTAQKTINVAAANDAPEIADWYHSDWGYRKEILVGAGQVSADLVGFPLLVHLNSDADLASFAQADADDILFTAGDGTTQLAHEVELFTSATGELFAWVKTDLSAAQDTRLYLYYGNAGATNQQDVVNVWDSGFQGVWHLNDSPDGTAGEINDSTANNNDGTTEGTMDAADLVTTKIGSGLDFDEVDDLIRINDSASLDSTASTATIEVWVNWDNVADGDHQILMTSSNRFTTGAKDGYEWASNGSGNHFYYPEGGTDPNYVLGPSPYTNGVWHHVALTQDFATKEVEIYVDGVAMSFSSDTLATTWTTLADPADWLWGGNPDRATRYFDGMMDEIRVSNLVRSQDWIQASFASQDNPSAFFSLGSAETENLTLTDINEDDLNPVGDTVASIVASAGGDRITDADSGAVEGVAVIGVDDTNGTWQYDVGSGWTNFGAVSNASAVLLDGTAKIRFVPDADYSGPSGDITFRAWDTTDGNPSGTTAVDVSTNGGSTAYGGATDSASLNVLAVNDSPVEASIEGTTLAYTENGGAVAITSTLALSDSDDTNLESAVVQITGNYANGQDVLTFVDQNGISGVWNAGSGTLTLTGTATVAQYQAALRSITYTNTSDNPSTATRTVSFTVNDGDVNSNTQTRDISIAATNDDPSGAGLPSDITVTEDVSSNVDLSALNLSDVDANGGNLTVTLSTSTGGNLSASSGGGVTVGGSGGGTLTLTGTLSDLNTFLDTPANIQYLHGTPHTFGNDADTIQVVVNDGGNTGSGGGTDQTIGTVNVDITGVNDEQVLATNTGDTVAEGSTGNTVTTAMLETTDVDNTDSQLVYTVDAVPTNGTLYRNGVALSVSNTFTQADIDAGLITYDHDGSETSSDSFDFTVDDGTGTTTSSTFNWTVTAANDAPVEASIEGTTLAYTENGGAVAITSTLALSDSDDTNLESAVVQITGNYANGQDVLTFVDQNGISGVWNAGSGTLALTGTATVAQYQAALRSITYTNTSDNPSTATRTVSFTVNDGDVNSNTQTRDISIAATNDDPTGTGLPSDITVTEDVSSNVDLSALNLSDVDANSGNLTVTLSTSTGGNLSASTGGGVTVGGSGTGTLTLIGTLADLNTFLDTPANVQYLHGTPHTFGNDADTIQVVVNDGGNTGSGGGTDQTIGTVNVDITAVNDEQVVSTNTGVTVAEGSTGNVLFNTMLETTDVDNSVAQLVYTVDALPINGTLYRNAVALNVSDTFTQADIDAGLITYDHDGSSTVSDSFDFTVDDGAGTTTSSTFNWTISGINDAPIASSVEGGTLAYTENDGAVAITASIALSDVDDTNLESAVVQVSGNYDSAEDLLSFTDQNGIVGSWDSGTGRLTLTGTATVAQYEAALRSITYTNTSDNPSTATRTVSFTVNDGDVNSNTQTRDISIAATNDDPTGTGLPGDITVTEDVTSHVDLSALNLSDVDANTGNLTVTLSTSTGGNLTASSGGGITVGGSGTGTLTLMGSLADLNTFLDTSANVQYLHGTLNTFGNDADTIQVVVNDGGNTGSGGGTDQTIGTVNVDITAVNEAPTATGESFTVNPGDSLSVTAPGVIFNDTDVDGDTLAVVLVTGPTNGSFSLEPGGGFTYTPNPGFFGQDSFFYRVTDGSLSSNVAEAVIEVPLFSFAGGSFELASVEAPVADQSPSSEPAIESEPDLESELESEESSQETESNSTGDAAGVSSVTAPAATPKSQVTIESGEKTGEGGRGQEAPSLDVAEASQQQRLAAYATADDAANYVLSDSPELKQLERLLQQDMQQAIVWTQWDDSQTEEEHTPMTVFVGAAGAGMSVFSVGYVFWALRGGALMTVFASSLPAWRFIDPIAMLSAYRSSQLTPDEGLEAMIGRGGESRGR